MEVFALVMHVLCKLLQTLKCSPPVSIASMRASVSLLRMQSMRWRWVRSPALSKRRSPEAPLRSRGAMLDLGRALRPSKSRTRSRSTRRMVSRTHLLSWEDDGDSKNNNNSWFTMYIHGNTNTTIVTQLTLKHMNNSYNINKLAIIIISIVITSSVSSIQL